MGTGLARREIPSPRAKRRRRRRRRRWFLGWFSSAEKGWDGTEWNGMEWNGVYVVACTWVGRGCKGVRRLITQFQDCHYPPSSRNSASIFFASLLPLRASFRNVNCINAAFFFLFVSFRVVPENFLKSGRLLVDRRGRRKRKTAQQEILFDLERIHTEIVQCERVYNFVGKGIVM